MNVQRPLFPALMAVLLLAGCGGNEPATTKTKEEVKDSAKPVAAVSEPKRGPIINIGDTIALKKTVLTIRDSAASFEGIGAKLQTIYGEKLAAALKKGNLKATGAPMAWYRTDKAPYFFEAGIPVDKKPAKLPAGIHVREVGADSIVIAHFYGPYDLLPQAYDALKDWLKDHKKTAKGAPYEIYIGDPVDSTGKPKDPYKVQTDVVFPWK